MPAIHLRPGERLSDLSAFALPALPFEVDTMRHCAFVPWLTLVAQEATGRCDSEVYQ